jgi:glycosyl transferase family 87
VPPNDPPPTDAPYRAADAAGGPAHGRVATATRRPGPAAVVAWVLVALALAVAVVLTVRHPDGLVTLLPSPNMHELHVDFDTFRYSSVALSQGDDIYATPAKLPNLNPPLLSVLLLPFAWLDALTGYRIFAGLTLLLTLGSLLAAARELRLRPAVRVAVVLVALAASPLQGTLVLGQIYPILLAGLVAGWIAERRGHPVAAAVLYGIVVALKPSLVPILLLAAVQRRWLPFRAGVASAAVATLVGVFAAGPSSALEWLRIAVGQGSPDVTDNASLPGLAVRFGLPSAVGLAVGAVVLLGTLARLARHRDRVDPAGTALWAVLATGLLVSPIAWHNYSLLLWPGLLLLVAAGRGPSAAAAAAVAVIPVSWAAEWDPEAVGPTVAAVARSLYCAILVGYWVVLLRAAVRPGDPEPPAPAGGDHDPAGVGSADR